MYHPEEYVKITNINNINNNFTFKEGLNEDIYELNEKEKCSQGGLYFCRFKDIGRWIEKYGKNCNIWRVSIPNGEKVIDYNDKLKAKRIILSDCQSVYENYEICKLAVQENGLALQFVKNQTEKICELAVQQDEIALQFVK